VIIGGGLFAHGELGVVLLTAGEVIGALLRAGHVGVKRCIATIFGAENAILESTRVLKVDVQLAVLAVLCRCNSRTNRCHIGVKDQSESIPSQCWLLYKCLVLTHV
jgi:hypothetical protein